ncbi:Uncharacterised protein [Oligella ureolytica]|uniref:Uncharacterized protein n=1 Tax=Oligella ureolytica TaxID=90244 RepID=A0A378X9Q7_9BURK|nr:Uncharacterised protein [Oligella ureolytica]SUA51575.1 Uncharacterised protein [Oligella ureolytica]
MGIIPSFSQSLVSDDKLLDRGYLKFLLFLNYLWVFS